MKTITIIGIKTDSGAVSEITLANEPPIASILSGELLVALHAHKSFQILNSETAASTQDAFVGVTDGKGDPLTGDVKIGANGDGTTGAENYYVSSSSNNAVRKELKVVTGTPAADKEIQLTDVNKFNLLLDPGMKEPDTLILKVMIIGEVMRP